MYLMQMKKMPTNSYIDVRVGLIELFIANCISYCLKKKKKEICSTQLT